MFAFVQHTCASFLLLWTLICSTLLLRGGNGGAVGHRGNGGGQQGRRRGLQTGTGRRKDQRAAQLPASVTSQSSSCWVPDQLVPTGSAGPAETAPARVGHGPTGLTGSPKQDVIGIDEARGQRRERTKDALTRLGPVSQNAQRRRRRRRPVRPSIDKCISSLYFRCCEQEASVK